MFDQITMLVEMIDLLSLDHQISLREGNDPLVRLRELREAGEAGKNDDLLLAMSTLTQNELFRVFAAMQIRSETLTSEQIGSLYEFLLNDDNISLKTAVVKRLQLATEPIAIDHLIYALIRCRNPQLCNLIAYAISKNSLVTWKGKIARMLLALQRHKYYRENLNCATLIIAIRPLVEELADSRFLLTDYLIKMVIDLTDDVERVTGILAGLIIESVGHNLNRANQRVGEYEYVHDESATTLTFLRAEMNSLLTPVERQARLEDTFAGPLRDTHEKIRKIWEESIKNVEISLQSRRVSGEKGILVSVIILLFAVGMIVFQYASGYWIALIGIVTLIIMVIYNGSIHDSNQVLTEIGVANAVYVAYVQRTLEISNAYAHLYLQNKLTNRDLKLSNQLISEAMNDTVKALRGTGKISIEDLLN